jgi:catechol 2,3-dioxygenase-like lactoylglutathione lyase family enzyme
VAGGPSATAPRGPSLVAFVGTVDLDRARGFHSGLLGLELVEQTSFACVFASGAATLRVTAVAEVVRAPYTVLGSSVPDIDRAVGELAGRDIELLRFDGIDQDEMAIWSAPGGARVAWFADPDGNTPSASQVSGSAAAVDPGR